MHIRNLLSCFIFLCATTLASAQYINTNFDVYGYSGNEKGTAIQYDPTTDGWLIGCNAWCFSPGRECWALLSVDKNLQSEVIYRHDQEIRSIDLARRSKIFHDTLLNRYTLFGHVLVIPDSLTRPFMLVREQDSTIHYKELPQLYDQFTVRSVEKMADGTYVMIVYITQDGEQQVALLHLDTQGEVLHSQLLTHPASKADYSGDVDFLSNGDIIYTHIATIIDEGLERTLVARLDTNFNEIWRTLIPQGGLFGDTRRLAIGQDGSIAVSGTLDSLVVYSEDEYYVGPHSSVYGLSSDGELLWQHSFLISHIAYIFNIKRAANGDIIGCGYSTDPAFETPDNYVGVKGWLFRLSPEGEVKWNRLYVDMDRWVGSNMTLEDLAEHPDGSIAAVGRRIDTFPDGYVHSDVWLMVVDSNGCFTPGCEEDNIVLAIDEPDEGGIAIARPVSFTVFPNPVETTLTVRFREPVRQEDVLRLYDTQGRVLGQRTLAPSQTEVPWSVAELPPGTYLLGHHRAGQLVSQRTFVRQ